MFGNKPLDGITRNQVKQFLFEKQEAGFALETVKNLRGYLSSIFSEAIDDGIITVNPVANTGKYIKKAEKLEGDTVKPLAWEEKAQLEKTAVESYPRGCKKRPAARQDPRNGSGGHDRLVGLAALASEEHRPRT